MVDVPTAPGRVDFHAYRWVPFKRRISILGVDLTGATVTAQVRQYGDAPDPPLIDLAIAAAGSQGVSVTLSPTADVPTSVITIQINETTIEGLLPAASNGLEPGANVSLKWAMHVSGTGLTKARWFDGDFTIIPGANQA